MNTTTTSLAQGKKLLRTLYPCIALFLVSIVATGCASLETRLLEAEKTGRLEEAFWLSVEYHDDNVDDAEKLPIARAALERTGNVYVEHLIRSAESAISNEYFTTAIEHLYQHPKHSATAVIQAADTRGIALAKRTVPELMRNGVYAAVDAYYQRGVILFTNGDWNAAIAHFTKMQGLKNANWYIAESHRELQYAHAVAEFHAGRYRSAYAELGKLESKYKNVADLRAQSVQLGKMVVAVFGFSYDRENAIQREITHKLLQDVFIEVVNADNLDKFSRISPGAARTTSVDFIINGSTNLRIAPPLYKTINFEQEAWVVTDNYSIVDSTKHGYRYVHVAYPLGFVQQKVAIEGTINVHYEIAEAKDFTTVASDDIYAHTEDQTVQWSYSGSYSPDRFTLRNPALDTLLRKSPWYPSREDCRFQEYFTKQKPLISPHVLAETLVATGAEETANAVLSALYRLEEKRLLSTR